MTKTLMEVETRGVDLVTGAVMGVDFVDGGLDVGVLPEEGGCELLEGGLEVGVGGSEDGGGVDEGGGGGGGGGVGVDDGGGGVEREVGREVSLVVELGLVPVPA